MTKIWLRRKLIFVIVTKTKQKLKNADEINTDKQFPEVKRAMDYWAQCEKSLRKADIN